MEAVKATRPESGGKPVASFTIMPRRRKHDVNWKRGADGERPAG
jgi:hypothetical protein